MKGQPPGTILSERTFDCCMFTKLIPYDAAYIILEAYLQYHHLFKRITKRAKIRFEHRDWHGIQEDARSRLTLYRDSVGDTTDKLLSFLGERRHDREIWQELKDMFLDEITNFNTRNIAETYYNSVFRHSHRGLSVDEELMFVHATGTYREFKSAIPIYHTLYLTDPIEVTVQQLFTYFRFDAPFEDLNRDIRFICETLRKKLLDGHRAFRTARIEVLKSVFFRNKAAYVVGRLYLDDKLHPFVLPLLHDDRGIFVDTVLLEMNDVSSIFSYNRSYFLVETDIVSEQVDFLRSILPTKSMGEVYNSIGFEKHGKTVLYRDFLRHLQISTDQFEFTPGIKGMVMTVFHLPSYNMVFKVIKDRFAAPKRVTEQEVREKYEIVSLHDRVGRMADSHVFQNFVFDRSRISEDLLEELISECGSKVIVQEDTVEISHMYIEKKMIPLNLFLETAKAEEAREVIQEYGKAIKQMACVNIFPGDMLLKNFGVTRLKRVVFYDYDEIGFLTDYNFRRIPEPRSFEDEWASEPWYSVGPNDVFPEEFPKFLIGRKEIKDMFLERHRDLFDVTFWIDVQKRLEAGELVTVYPYRQRLRFRKTFRHEFDEASQSDQKEPKSGGVDLDY